MSTSCSQNKIVQLVRPVSLIRVQSSENSLSASTTSPSTGFLMPTPGLLRRVLACSAGTPARAVRAACAGVPLPNPCSAPPARGWEGTLPRRLRAVFGLRRSRLFCPKCGNKSSSMAMILPRVSRIVRESPTGSRSRNWPSDLPTKSGVVNVEKSDGAAPNENLARYAPLTTVEVSA
jgi:hypothetical protein